MKTNFSNAFLYAIEHNETANDMWNLGEMKVLLACESGSRAWGFASPDSDFDIRFVYALPKDRYISLVAPRDVIEFTVTRPGLVLDVVGWDIRKYLHLMGKGNAQTYEWLKCPPYYRTPSWFMDIVDIANEHPNLRAVGEHYHGLARSHLTKYVIGKDLVSCKRYLYLFRSLYSLKWIVDRPSKPLPLRYDHLMDAMAHERIYDYSRDLLSIKVDVKGTSEEKVSVPPCKEINDLVIGQLELLIGILRRSEKFKETRIDRVWKWEVLDKFFLQTLDNY